MTFISILFPHSNISFESNLYQHSYQSFNICIKQLRAFCPHLPPTPPVVSPYPGIIRKLFAFFPQNSSPITHAFNWVRHSVKSAVTWRKSFPTLHAWWLHFSPCLALPGNYSSCTWFNNWFTLLNICLSQVKRY